MVKEIKLYNGEISLIDDDDFELVSKYSWRLNTVGYAITTTKRSESKDGKQTTILMHRLIMGSPKGFQIDHINHNKLDNRKENLRLATAKENSQHRLKPKTNISSKYKGVTYRKKYNRWDGHIYFNNESIFLGSFTNEKACALAYNYYANKYFGEFAVLNEIDEDLDWNVYRAKSKDEDELTSKKKGVCFRNGGWVAQIYLNGKTKYLGYFKNEEDAIKARVKAEKVKARENKIND